MAKVRAFEAIDMSNFRSEIGTSLYADDDLLVVGIGSEKTYYFGSFSYPDGRWQGTVTSIYQYDLGLLDFFVKDIAMPTSYATIGADRESVYRTVLNGADRITGSNKADILMGFAGKDSLEGKRGADKLFSGSGADVVLGGSGRDRLKTAGGDDLLVGGRGDDRLTGGRGEDRFVFKDGDGKDVITDFRPGRDEIKIKSGAERIRDLDFEQKGDNVAVSFADTRIVFEDLEISDLGWGDFLF